MKDSWKRVSGLLLIALTAVAMIAPGLHAGPPMAAKFKLPFDAHLGKMVLPTGDYSLSLDHATLNTIIRFYHDERAMGMVLAQSFDGHRGLNENPQLICIRHNGTVTVRALRWPNVGTFYFSLPKELQSLTAKEPKLIETVSVEVTGQ